MSNFSISINYGYDISAEDRFRLVADTGFSGVGLWWGKKTNGFEVGSEEQFRLAKKYGLHIDYIHAPFSFHNHLRDEDKSVRNEGIEIHKSWIDTLTAHNADKIVLHLNRLTNDEYITPNLIESLWIINEYAVKNGVKLAVENIGRPDDLQLVFDNIPNIYFCFDSSHASLEGDTEGRILAKYVDKLICTHLSDNDTLEDKHWLLGKGVVNFDKICKILVDNGYKGMINCEVVEDSDYTADSYLRAVYQSMQKYFGVLNVR